MTARGGQMRIRGLVFDKDGTLFDYTATWAVWCDRLLTELSGGDPDLHDRMARACGFDPDTMSFVAGSVVVNGTGGEVIDTWAPFLSLPEEEIHAVALRHLDDVPQAPVCDLDALFANLRQRGLVLGLATNDYEQSAHKQLRDAGVAAHFGFVCGYDSGHGTKPGPGMIEAFCRQTGIPASETAMVGDSTHDLGAGRAAGVGLTIGVLTGPARSEDIAHLADHVVADISAIPALLDAG